MACHAIAELIIEPGSLRSLQLYNNMSDNDGAAAIAGLLTRAPLMADFRMASSRVGALGGIALAQALTTGEKLSPPSSVLASASPADNGQHRPVIPPTTGKVCTLSSILPCRPPLSFFWLQIDAHPHSALLDAPVCIQIQAVSLSKSRRP